jgi:hypothetical protein
MQAQACNKREQILYLSLYRLCKLLSFIWKSKFGCVYSGLCELQYLINTQHALISISFITSLQKRGNYNSGLALYYQ